MRIEGRVKAPRIQDLGAAVGEKLRQGNRGKGRGDGRTSQRIRSGTRGGV